MISCIPQRLGISCRYNGTKSFAQGGNPLNDHFDQLKHQGLFVALVTHEQFSGKLTIFAGAKLKASKLLSWFEGFGDKIHCPSFRAFKANLPLGDSSNQRLLQVFFPPPASWLRRIRYIRVMPYSPWNVSALLSEILPSVPATNYAYAASVSCSKSCHPKYSATGAATASPIAL